MLKLWTPKPTSPGNITALTERRSLRAYYCLIYKAKAGLTQLKCPLSAEPHEDSGHNETTRLTELRYVYLSFEHEVLGPFAQRRVLIHLCCCVQGVFIDLGQVQRKMSSVVVRPDTM